MLACPLEIDFQINPSLPKHSPAPFSLKSIWITSSCFSWPSPANWTTSNSRTLIHSFTVTKPMKSSVLHAVEYTIEYSILYGYFLSSFYPNLSWRLKVTHLSYHSHRISLNRSCSTPNCSFFTKTWNITLFLLHKSS